jgi:hypothetical protein
MKYTITGETTKQAVKDYIERLNLSKIWTVDISRKTESRTISQNKLYWLWLTCVEQETGNDKELLHLYFKNKYLPKKEIVLIDEVIELPGSTTGLTTEQFSRYLEKINIFAGSELAIELPHPEDLIFDAFYDSYKQKL